VRENHDLPPPPPNVISLLKGAAANLVRHALSVLITLSAPSIADSAITPAADQSRAVETRAMEAREMAIALSPTTVSIVAAPSTMMYAPPRRENR